ncbi:hypothetical protein AALO_G00190780 [Alosa alosa]|uniref:Uncharacterized protein n=1 Tax=Alosa alosa TaxID=278164 RepID=A0AAV6G842_9TELE|nr:hypothetical protein AALO_G00190780 [Alosa alosa]
MRYPFEAFIWEISKLKRSNSMEFVPLRFHKFSKPSQMTAGGKDGCETLLPVAAFRRDKMKLAALTWEFWGFPVAL